MLLRFFIFGLVGFFVGFVLATLLSKEPKKSQKELKPNPEDLETWRKNNK